VPILAAASLGVATLIGHGQGSGSLTAHAGVARQSVARTAEPSPGPADASERGGARLAGTVRNGTAGGSIPAGAVVEARRVSDVDADAADAVTTTVRANGGFELVDPSGRASDSYVLAVQYAGVRYEHPEAVPVGEAAEVTGIDLLAYEAAEGVPTAVTSGHLVLEPSPELGVIGVIEVWTLANSTDRAALPGPEGGARFTLPTGAHGLSLLGEGTPGGPSLDGRTVVDRAPVPPGQRQFVLRYDLPYRGRSLHLDRAVDQPVGRLQVIVAAEGAAIESPWLGAAAPMQVEGRTVMVAEARDVPVGIPLDVRLDGLPQAGTASGADPDIVMPIAPPPVSAGATAAVALALAAAGAALVLAYPVLRSSADDPAAVQRRYERAVEAIAALDAAQARVPEAPERYARRRAALMSTAMEAWRTREERQG
jgi:hypothetical protein